MKKLRKNLTVGKYEFTLEINKDIAISVFEEVPEMVGLVDEAMQKNKTQNSGFGEILEQLKEQNDEKDKKDLEVMRKMAVVALKQMYRAVETNNTADDNFFDEFWNYVDENNAELLICTTIFEFVMQGFTLGKELKPKIKIVLK